MHTQDDPEAGSSRVWVGIKSFAKRVLGALGWVLLILPSLFLFWATVRAEGSVAAAGMVVTSVFLFTTIYSKLRWVALFPFAVFSFGAYIQYLNDPALNEFFISKGEVTTLTWNEVRSIWLVYGGVSALYVVGDLLTDRGLVWGIRYMWKLLFVRSSAQQP